VKPADKGSWFFTLNVSNAGNKSYISCNVTDAELRLIKVLITVSWRQRSAGWSGSGVECKCATLGCPCRRGEIQAGAAAYFSLLLLLPLLHLPTTNGARACSS
jgi:hypothetical protein